MTNKKDIVKAIRLIWSSLDSHLNDTYDPIFDKIKDKKAKEQIGNRAFHAKCVREYSEVISILSNLL